MTCALVLSFNSKSNYIMQFASFVIIGLVIASFKVFFLWSWD
jgi:hypothetical protein